MAVVITDENLEEIISSNKVVLLDVFATWCGPCKMLSPVIDELSRKNINTEGLVIGKADVDDTPYISNEKFKVRSVPSVFIIKDGEVKETIVGSQPESKYQEAIDKYLADEDEEF
jgi:thioredoxin 1